MIVISGALVLVAAVLLVLGIISSITLVYAAIGLSIVSAVFLLVGVFQRPAPASEPRESESEGTRRQASQRDERDERPAKRSISMSKAAEPEDEPAWEPAEDEPIGDIDLVDADEISADFPLEKANADFETRSGAVGADVLVISGRPRYHVGGCEYVDGNDDSEPLEINEARELGFTPCGACRPNETLARSASGKEHAAHPKPSPVNVSEPATASYEPAPVTVAAAAPIADPQNNHQSHQTHQIHPAPPQQATPQQAAPAVTPPPVSQPVAYATPPAPVAPPEPAQVVTPPPVASAPPVAVPEPPAPVTEPQPAVPAAVPAAAPPATDPPTAGRAGRASRTVQAVASTKQYHRPDCEMLTGAEAEEITKVAAIRQGYLACGICKP